MRLIDTAAQFSSMLAEARSRALVVGLVPTMGALHDGHRSLLERAADECGFVAASIFVNPLQFDSGSDLASYPRTLADDLSVAEEAGADLVFAPGVEEMYPGYPEPVPTRVHVASLGDRLEGASRPGHFDGVATVVTKLLALAGPCRAYFGEKDYQQLALVRRLVEDLSLPADIVGCPTVREPGGLALSSRNVRLSEAERSAALALHQSLQAGRAASACPGADPASVRNAMWEVLGSRPLVEPDYAEVVDAHSLEPAGSLSGELRLLVAAKVGPVRLIDNLPLVVDEPLTGDLPADSHLRSPRDDPFSSHRPAVPHDRRPDEQLPDKKLSVGSGLVPASDNHQRGAIRLCAGA